MNVLGSVMYHLAESLRFVSILIQPFMTETPKTIWQQLGVKESLTVWTSLEEFAQLPAGTKVEKGTPIFPRLDVEEEVAHIVEMMGGNVAKKKKTFQKLTKMRLRLMILVRSN